MTFGTIHDYTKWLHSFCGYKKPFFFSYHSSGKTFRQNDDVPIVNLQLFFRRNPPTSGAWKKKLNVQNKTKVGEEKKLSCFFRDSFLFWAYEKKNKAWWTKFLVVLPPKCCCNIFWLLRRFIGWCVRVFFSYVQNKKEYRKKQLSFFSSLTFVLFWTFSFFFHAPGGRGDFFWKKVANWRSGHRHYVEIFFQKNDLKFFFFIRKTNAII